MSIISKFNPQTMNEDDVLALSTGRDNLLKMILFDLEICLDSNNNQHFVFYGPRGIGKSFFIRLLKINHDRSINIFKDSEFIQLPEEQSNLCFVADLLDMLSIKLEGGDFDQLVNRWNCSDSDWTNSKKRLKSALKKKNNIKHVFFSMENLQEFIPNLDHIENGRMREFLSDFKDFTILGSSLHPNLDNNYNAKLFQVFKKYDILPWKSNDFTVYFRKKADLKSNKFSEKQLNVAETKFAAITDFTGGSPRLAVILSNLILNNEILSTAEIFEGALDELTPYYQDLTKDIPSRSKILFDTLIREGENISQSELATKLQPPQQQSTIARSFNWLIDNFYVVYQTDKSTKAKKYYLRDRMYAIYYRNREIKADKKNAFIALFVDFLATFYSVEELHEQMLILNTNNENSKKLLDAYCRHLGLIIEEKEEVYLKKEVINDYKLLINLLQNNNFEKALNLFIEKPCLQKVEKLMFDFIDLICLEKEITTINNIKKIANSIKENHFKHSIINIKFGLFCYRNNLYEEAYFLLNNFKDDEFFKFYLDFKLDWGVICFFTKRYIEACEFFLEYSKDKSDELKIDFALNFIKKNQYGLALNFYNKSNENKYLIKIVQLLKVELIFKSHAEKFLVLKEFFHEIFVKINIKQSVLMIFTNLINEKETDLLYDFLTELTYIPEVYNEMKEFIDLFLIDIDNKLIHPDKQKALEIFKDFLAKNNLSFDVFK